MRIFTGDHPCSPRVFLDNFLQALQELLAQRLLDDNGLGIADFPVELLLEFVKVAAVQLDDELGVILANGSHLDGENLRRSWSLPGLIISQ